MAPTLFMQSRQKWFRCLLVLAMLVHAPVVGCAQEQASSSPMQEEVSAMIDGLSSVRDFDRLRWILNAVEGQEISVRALLLDALDHRIETLTRADTDAPIIVNAEHQVFENGAVEAQQSSPETPVSEQISAGDAPVDLPPAWMRRLSDDQTASEINFDKAESSLVVERLRRSIEEEPLPADGDQRVEKLATWSLEIAALEDSDRRRELSEKLKQRKESAMKEEIESRKRQIIERLSGEGIAVPEIFMQPTPAPAVSRPPADRR